MRGLLITGTDTGAGKTTFAAALARCWRKQGRRFHVCKPVATGVPADKGSRIADDTRILAEAAGDSDFAAITPWTFAAAAAPPVAARLEGGILRLTEIVGAVERRAEGNHAVLVEAVGGLLCPLTERETVADLAVQLQLPLVLVARRGLGTLNHTLLTMEAAERRRLVVAGIVVSETQPVDGVAAETNIEELRRLVGAPLLAILPFDADGPERHLTLPTSLDWWHLAERPCRTTPAGLRHERKPQSPCKP